MKKISLLLLIVISFLSCKNSKDKATSLEQFIPESSHVILKINNLETFKSDINNNHLISALSKKHPYEKLKKTLNDISGLPIDSSVFVCFEKESDSIVFTIISKQADSLSEKLSAISFRTKIIDSIQIASTSERTLNSVKPNKDGVLNSYFNTTNPDKSFSVLLPKSTTNIFLNSILNQQEDFGDWLVFDNNISQNSITFNGILSNTDSIKTITSIFKNSIPQENTIQHIAPKDAESILSITFSDYTSFQQNLSAYNTQRKDSLSYNEIFGSINEVSTFKIDNENVFAIHSLDETLTDELLSLSREKKILFRDLPIYKYNDSKLFIKTFTPLLASDSISYYSKIDNYFVFSNHLSPIEKVISSYQNGSTLSKHKAFQSIFENLSDESSLLFFTTNISLQNSLNTIFKTENTPQLKDYKISAFQLIKDDNYTHFNAVIDKQKSSITQEGITEEFSVKIGAELLTTPQFVINHRNKLKEIIVQDINNKLYLISNSGKVLWTKTLNGKILGKVQQVDLYKNGRLQLAFATARRVYIIDRNGKDVKPFPVKFNDEITQPLSVFDYDKNKNYRFLITQGKNLLMLNKEGKFIKGFRYNPQSTIINQPQHFRIGSKDFIVFSTKNSIRVLNRRGQQRIKVKEEINFSDNSIYWYQNKFTSSTKDGKLVQVNLNGNVSYLSLGLEQNHKIDATSKTLATLSENNLNIKQKTYELDFGNYTPPEIFYINDKIYITVTDLQSKRIFLFDSQAKLQSYFPVYGSSSIDLSNIDKDRNLEFVTIGDNNSIIVYQKN